MRVEPPFEVYKVFIDIFLREQTNISFKILIRRFYFFILCSKEAHGTYWFVTNKEPPYAEGFAGGG